MNNICARKKSEGGMSVIEVVISFTMFSVAILGLGFGMSSIMDTQQLLKSDLLAVNACHQALQETLMRDITVLEGYNPPNEPSQKTISTFTVSGAQGTGEVRLSIKKTTGASKLFRIHSLFINNGQTIVEMETYLTKIIE